MSKRNKKHPKRSSEKHFSPTSLTIIGLLIFVVMILGILLHQQNSILYDGAITKAFTTKFGIDYTERKTYWTKTDKLSSVSIDLDQNYIIEEARFYDQDGTLSGRNYDRNQNGIDEYIEVLDPSFNRLLKSYDRNEDTYTDSSIVPLTPTLNQVFADRDLDLYWDYVHITDTNGNTVRSMSYLEYTKLLEHGSLRTN